MAKETKILKLYQVTRPEDDDKAFNIQTMLNDNWDKIDKAFEKASTEEAEEGTNTEKIMTPKTTKDAILKLAPQLEYKDVTNLSTTPSGVISWVNRGADQTREAVVMFRATKDISNYDYISCTADSDVVGNALSKDVGTYTYTGLVNNTQYWVKVFTRYLIGGKLYYSNGVTVTFRTLAVKITEFYNAGNEFNAVTGGWVIGNSAPASGTITHKKESVNLSIYASSNAGGDYVTNNIINLSSIKTLKIEWSLAETTPTRRGEFKLGMSKTNGLGEIGSVVITNSFAKTISTLDATNVSSAYIKVYLGTPSSGEGTLKIYRVWGES